MPYPQNILSVLTLFMHVHVQKVIFYSAHGQTTMSPILGEKVRFCARRLLCTQKKAQLFPLLSSFVGSRNRNAAKKKNSCRPFCFYYGHDFLFFFYFQVSLATACEVSQNNANYFSGINCHAVHSATAVHSCTATTVHSWSRCTQHAKTTNWQ